MGPLRPALNKINVLTLSAVAHLFVCLLNKAACLWQQSPHDVYFGLTSVDSYLLFVTCVALLSACGFAGDSLAVAHIVHSDEDDVVVASKQGAVMRCAAKDVRALSRGAKGVRLMSLQADDEVQTLAVIPAEYKTALS